MPDMDSILSSVILGIVQGLTEFLPVSSSGHLVIFQSFLLPGGENLLFDILLHVATLFAVVIVFRDKIARILSGLFFFRSSPHRTESWKWAGWILAGLVPTGVIGVVFKEPLEKLFDSPLTVSFMLIVTGLLLISTLFRKMPGSCDGLAIWQAMAIGTVQGIAIIPGISRSGSTIAVALLLGISRSVAGEYSFLVSLPAIAGALLLQLKDSAGAPIAFSIPSLAAGFVAAFAVGIVALLLLMRFVRNGKLHYFAFYCWLIGIVGIIHFWR